jgi:hypothetical protein
MPAAEQRTEFVELPTGQVALKQGHNRYTVRLEGGERVARRAASCLLVPEPGDRVVLAFTPEPYIIAVLERKGDNPSELVLEGDARVTAPSGRLDIQSAEGVTLTSRVVSLFGGELRARAEKATLTFRELETIAVAAKTAIDAIVVHAHSYDGFIERITERAARVYRMVSEYDQLRARHFDYRAEESAQIKGKNTVLIAREVAKVDGEQIHVG